MTALKRIKSYWKLKPVPNCCALCPDHEVKFLLRVVRVYREIACQYRLYIKGEKPLSLPSDVDEEFEKRMANK